MRNGTEETIVDILLVDDDGDLSAVTADYLSDNGFLVRYCSNGEDALEALNKITFKLIILDVNLGETTGFELCQRIREFSNLPIIFISARTSDTDKIKGLDIGGDDYIGKPYSLKELLSRVNANIRRSFDMSRNMNTVYFDDICIDLEARRVTRNNSEIEMTAKEFELLKYLIQHKNQALDKERIFDTVWGVYNVREIGTLTVHIRWLREKIEKDPSNPKHIKTLWGVGYIFEV